MTGRNPDGAENFPSEVACGPQRLSTITGAITWPRGSRKRGLFVILLTGMPRWARRVSSPLYRPYRKTKALAADVVEEVKAAPTRKADPPPTAAPSIKKCRWLMGSETWLRLPFCSRTVRACA